MLFNNCLFWFPVTQDSWNGPKLIAAPIWHLLDIKVPNFHTYAMRGSRKFCQRGSKFDNFFFSWWGDRGSKYHCKWAIISLPAKCHLNGVSLAGWWFKTLFKWPYGVSLEGWWLPNIECWLCRLVIFQGIGTSIAKKPYIFFYFSKGVPTPCPPSGSAHVCIQKHQKLPKTSTRTITFPKYDRTSNVNIAVDRYNTSRWVSIYREI